MVGLDKIIDKFKIVFDPPPGWVHTKTAEIEKFFEDFPLISGNRLPLSTYLIFAKNRVRFDLSTLFATLFSSSMKAQFLEQLPQMKEEASLQAELDQKNFESEVKAFDNSDDPIAAAIIAPHLDISEVYRYAAALQASCLFAVNADLFDAAVYQLRANPYLYFAYGDAYMGLMPISWEDL